MIPHSAQTFPLNFISADSTLLSSLLVQPSFCFHTVGYSGGYIIS